LYKGWIIPKVIRFYLFFVVDKKKQKEKNIYHLDLLIQYELTLFLVDVKSLKKNK